MIKAIISDSDGTLVNTVYLIRHGQYEAAVSYLTSLGIPRHEIPPYEVYESYINKSVGGSTLETFEKTLGLLFKGKHEKYLKKINLSELDNVLNPIQDHIAPLYVHPFHGLTELFSWMGKEQMELGIFTSGTPRHIVRNVGISLPVLGYTELFRADDIAPRERLEALMTRAKAVYGIPEIAIVTCDDVTKTKPDPEGILQLLEKLAIRPEEALVIGDHAADMQAATAAGIIGIGISHGFGTPAELKEAGARQVIDDIASLAKLIEAHNQGKSPFS